MLNGRFRFCMVSISPSISKQNNTFAASSLAGNEKGASMASSANRGMLFTRRIITLTSFSRNKSAAIQLSYPPTIVSFAMPISRLKATASRISLINSAWTYKRFSPLKTPRMLSSFRSRSSGSALREYAFAFSKNCRISRRFPSY